MKTKWKRYKRYVTTLLKMKKKIQIRDREGKKERESKITRKREIKKYSLIIQTVYFFSLSSCLE